MVAHLSCGYLGHGRMNYYQVPVHLQQWVN